MAKQSVPRIKGLGGTGAPINPPGQKQKAKQTLLGPTTKRKPTK